MTKNNSLLFIVSLLLIFAKQASALENNVIGKQNISGMTISYTHPLKQYEKILGSSWIIYLAGQIQTDTAADFENFLITNGVPNQSSIYLNSPGGSLYGGMKLGEVIRKHGFNTNVGISSDPLSLRSLPGECYSACTYAFLGGKFRYLTAQSHFGVHRFYSTNPTVADADTAQITSSQIVDYLKEMDISPGFFSLTTRAGATEVYEPTASDLKSLNITNEGSNSAKWSIAATSAGTYLKGEQETVFGTDKFMVMCKRGYDTDLLVIFDPQGHQSDIENMRSHSLVINGNSEPIVPVKTGIVNGWVNSAYKLTKRQITAIESAQSVGVTLQYSYASPIFIGFWSMPFDAGEQLKGLLAACE